MTSLPFHLDRTVEIRARQDTVFRFFTDPARWAAWWGAGSTIDAVPGGRMLIRYPGGVEAAGEVVELDPPSRIVFTYGYVSGQPFPPGQSRVTIQVQPGVDGSVVRLRHELPDQASRDHHVQGWRYQLSLFANIVSAEAAGAAETLADAWFGVWAEADAAARHETLIRIADAGIVVRDRFSALSGLEDLLPHIAAAQVQMPGVRLERTGPVRFCQGTGICEWRARAADGRELGAGTNVFEVGQDGRLTRVTGFWS